ncbi:unnamed protein product [Fusarium graminearum]|uniref:Chromosome 2, complete genome n=1 Tax=Gibberella zeae (strain ATCC MYA-4620 / CBS 123657 / FGSC 9075 / NRRL 31084 / PH-1) TaxID=229533 RepID=I1S916_GIBZE|nr:hypothetical protein FGSG_13346 [Fusarium graminearum PH-1]ESU14795.1 hypothetical protein FGSG_13346 [Fusarium graminearum PH-1]CEF76905.1 unnamed protein product [Fusarium graminearum]CZS80196.1 unnamed protein product [Fusarium graminearum]|eukprot:XP_011320220.1 hypothetical protein FGSG_13346 [Fusarium graminearum PH-1]
MTDSLLTLAATELLGLGCLGRGNDHYAFTYVSEVNSMGPFGVEPSVAIEKAKKAYGFVLLTTEDFLSQTSSYGANTGRYLASLIRRQPRVYTANVARSVHGQHVSNYLSIFENNARGDPKVLP